MATTLRLPRIRFFNTSLLPLSGALLYTCAQGAETISELKATYQDYDLTILNPNPIVLDSAGYARPCFGLGGYKIFVYGNDSILHEIDNILLPTVALISFNVTPSAIIAISLDTVIDNNGQLVNSIGLEATSHNLRFFDTNGQPLTSGKVYTCIAGAPSLHFTKATYADDALTVENGNPLVLDANGRTTEIYIDDGEHYKLFVFDKNNNLILTQDNVGGV